MRLSLLALLGDGSAYGNQLKSRFEVATGGSWPLNIGQVYQTLDRLVRDGLVVTDDTPAPGSPAQAGTRYRLTAAGEAVREQWFAEPVAFTGPPRDELAIKLVIAMSSPGVDVMALVDTQRRATMSHLQGLTRSNALRAPHQPAAQLVREREIFLAEAQLRWLDHCQAVLRAQARRGLDTALEGGSR